MNSKNIVVKKLVFMACIVCVFLDIIGGTTMGQVEKAIQESEFSQRLQKEIQQLKTIVISNPEDEEARRKNIVNKVYASIQKQMLSSSAHNVVQAYQTAFPSMPAKGIFTWTQRLAFKYENSDNLVVIHKLFWQSQHSELFVCQIDYISYYIRKTAYLKSAPPRMYLKTNEKLITEDLSTLDYFNLGSTSYTIHGFVHAHDEQICPDVLLSTGPVGSGNFVYFVQMHYDKPTQSWKPVWQIDRAYMIDIDYVEEQKTLTITYVTNRETGESEQSSYNLKWGGKDSTSE